MYKKSIFIISDHFGKQELYLKWLDELLLSEFSSRSNGNSFENYWLEAVSSDFVEDLDTANCQLLIGLNIAHELQLLERIKKRSPSTNVIFISRNPSVEKAVSAMRMGAEDYFDETVSKTALQKAARRGLERKVLSLAYLDDVTGLYNARYLHYLLDEQLKTVRQEKNSFALLFIDIDYFKKVNDTYGHLLGNQVLSELGLFLKNEVPSGGSVFRYGGDEFIILISEYHLQEAEELAEKIREKVARTFFLEKTAKNIKLTLSIGVALFPYHMATRSDLIQLADQAMYSAKKLNRNKVVLAHSQGSKPFLSSGFLKKVL